MTNLSEKYLFIIKLQCNNLREEIFFNFVVERFQENVFHSKNLFFILLFFKSLENIFH